MMIGKNTAEKSYGLIFIVTNSNYLIPLTQEMINFHRNDRIRFHDQKWSVQGGVVTQWGF